jgi:hypothetical protein
MPDEATPAHTPDDADLDRELEAIVGDGPTPATPAPRLRVRDRGGV